MGKRFRCYPTPQALGVNWVLVICDSFLAVLLVLSGYVITREVHSTA